MAAVAAVIAAAVVVEVCSNGGITSDNLVVLLVALIFDHIEKSGQKVNTFLEERVKASPFITGIRRRCSFHSSVMCVCIARAPNTDARTTKEEFSMISCGTRGHRQRLVTTAAPYTYALFTAYNANVHLWRARSSRKKRHLIPRCKL